jgi:outer membrane protein
LNIAPGRDVEVCKPSPEELSHMSLRSKLSVLAIALSLSVPALASAADLKVAYVDFQRVLLDVDDGKAAKARLQKWLESRQKEIDAEQETLRKEKETLDKQASAMSEETRIQKATDLQKKVYDLAQKWEKSRAEAADKERKEMEPIIGKIDEVIRRIAERDGLSMVFEKRDSGLVFALDQYDLTTEVIRTYNNSKGKAKDAPVAKDAPKK